MGSVSKRPFLGYKRLLLSSFSELIDRTSSHSKKSFTIPSLSNPSYITNHLDRSRRTCLLICNAIQSTQTNDIMQLPILTALALVLALESTALSIPEKRQGLDWGITIPAGCDPSAADAALANDGPNAWLSLPDANIPLQRRQSSCSAPAALQYRGAAANSVYTTPTTELQAGGYILAWSAKKTHEIQGVSGHDGGVYRMTALIEGGGGITAKTQTPDDGEPAPRSELGFNLDGPAKVTFMANMKRDLSAESAEGRLVLWRFDSPLAAKDISSAPFPVSS